jgi:hypothetical protein
MTVAKVSDETFIDLWRHHGSAAKVARVLDLAVRNVCARRVRLEQKYKIKLEAFSRPTKRPAHETHAPVHRLRIQNGTIIVASDLHFWPGIRTTVYNALLHFIALRRPAIVVMNGDVMDGAAISRHPRIGWERVPSVIQELDACTEYLGEIEEVAGGADLVWTLGNHCSRFASRLAAVAHEYANVQGFQLKDHFPSWTPCWRLDINDDIVIKHRLKGGLHATHNNTLTAGKTMVTGHLHALKVTPYSDYTGTRYGVDTGTVAEPDGAQFINYTEAAPMNWRSGFAILTFKDGRLLMPQLVQKWDADHVEFAGEVIKVSQWGKKSKPAKPALAKRAA